MLTNNFWDWLHVILHYGKSNANYQLVYYDGRVITCSYAATTLLGANTRNLLATALSYNTDAPTKSGVMFGSGATPPTRADYHLVAPITAGLSVVSPSSWGVNKTNDYIEYTFIYAVTATQDTTIAEIGLFAGTGDSSRLEMASLHERTVLDEPITIKAGETKAVKYTIRFNYQ